MCQLSYDCEISEQLAQQGCDFAEPYQARYSKMISVLFIDTADLQASLDLHVAMLSMKVHWHYLLAMASSGVLQMYFGLAPLPFTWAGVPEAFEHPEPYKPACEFTAFRQATANAFNS